MTSGILQLIIDSELDPDSLRSYYLVHSDSAVELDLITYDVMTTRWDANFLGDLQDSGMYPKQTFLGKFAVDTD